MLRRPLTVAELRVRFEVALEEARAGLGVPTGVGFDEETEAALCAVWADPASDLAVQRARDELEAQVSGAHARAREAERRSVGAERPSKRRSR